VEARVRGGGPSLGLKGSKGGGGGERKGKVPQDDTERGGEPQILLF